MIRHHIPTTSPVDHIGRAHGASREIRFTIDLDTERSEVDILVVGADGVVLDTCPQWAEIVAQKPPQTTIIDLSPPVTHPTQEATTTSPA